MNIEGDPNASGNKAFWERELAGIDTPKKNEIKITEVHDARNRFNTNRESDIDFCKQFNSVITLIKTEVGLKEDPIIRCPAEIAEGKKLILVLNSIQQEAFAIVYGMDFERGISYYATIRNTGEKQIEIKDVLIKCFDGSPKTTDNLIISEGLAKELELKENQDLRVMSVRHKTSKDINLDKI